MTEPMKWPEKKTALLVIHGVGQQSPFETLGTFTQGFVDAYRDAGRAVPLVQKRDYAAATPAHAEWVENYISMGPELDVYEYYWQHLMQRQITLTEVVDWLTRTSKGGTAFYDWMKKNGRDVLAPHRLEGVDVITKRGVDYLLMLGGWTRFCLWIGGWALPTLERRFPLLFAILRPIFYRIRQLIVDFAGDVAVYTTTDPKLRQYETRDRILRGAIEKVAWLAGLDRYERVVVAGHSLGSVIGYDVLNRLNNLMEVSPDYRKLAPKIEGFATFGSPLDKIAFFFFERMGETEHVRRQIINRYHGYRSVAARVVPAAYPVGGDVPKHLDHVRWINLFDREDPICGSLDFYEPNENVELKMGVEGIGAHTKYWSYAGFYRTLADRLF